MSYFVVKLDNTRYRERAGDMSIEDAREIAIDLLIKDNNPKGFAMIFIGPGARVPKYYIGLKDNRRYPKVRDYLANKEGFILEERNTGIIRRLNLDGTINRHDRRN